MLFVVAAFAASPIVTLSQKACSALLRDFVTGIMTGSHTFVEVIFIMQNP